MAVQKSPIAVAVVLVLLLIGISQTFYTVDEIEQGVVLQLGKPVGDTVGPGLHFKLPFVQDVVKFDSRILEYDAEPAEVITKDKKTLVVDNYARWRIEDPLLFYRTARTVEGGTSRLDDIVYSELRVALGRYTLSEIVSTKRAEIMDQVLETTKRDLKPYGIRVWDVRVKRTDLPTENQQAIFARMQSEREREARQYRSEGEEEAAKIRAEADKDRSIMLAEAERKAQTMRGEGDAEATKIYGQAYGQDAEFYAFTRSLEAYRTGFGDNSDLVLAPDTKFFQYLIHRDKE
ncbi:MAG: protease modulator HflC [Desulfovermiculus sp.]|nr:protease modulator HflC [Desulfovermiculus sp.]